MTNPSEVPLNQDILPTISCDIALGRLVTTVELDAHYFAQFMSQNGVSEEEISKTSIVVTAETIVSKKKYIGQDDVTVNYGSYEPPTRTAYIHLGSLKSSLDFYSQGGWNGQMPTELYDSLGTAYASKHMMHELGHRIVHSSGDDWFKEELEFFRDIVPEKLRSRVWRKVLRQFKSPSAHKLADLNRDREIMRGMDKPKTIEHYQGSPSERMAEDFSEQAENEWLEGYHPVKVSFRST